MRQCPDSGTCHHECTVGCWRVANAGPLSFYGEDWPAEVVAEFGENDGHI